MSAMPSSPEGTASALDQAITAAAAATVLPPPVDAGEWLTPERLLAPPEPILVGLLDAGSKMLIAGPSKARKSFFALELAVRLALGAPGFLGIQIPGPRRVLCVQPEIPAAHYQKRLVRVVRAVLGDEAEPRRFLGDRLAILNCRGARMWVALAQGCLTQLARQHRADLVLIDPVYKLLETGKEDSQDFRGLLAAFDQMADETGAAIGYVAHYPKGNAGDRNAIDRTAGSGWLARDMDAGLYLDVHGTEPDALVCTTITRSYPPRPDATVRYNASTGLFELLPDVAPEVRTSRSGNRGQAATAGAGIPEGKVLTIVSGGPLPMTEFRQRLALLGTQRAARAAVKMLIASGRLVKERRAGSHGVSLIGTPEQFAPSEHVGSPTSRQPHDKPGEQAGTGLSQRLLSL